MSRGSPNGTPKGPPGIKAAVTVIAVVATLAGWAVLADSGSTSGAGSASTSTVEPETTSPVDSGVVPAPTTQTAAESHTGASPAIRALRPVDMQLPSPRRARPDVRTHASQRR